MRRPRSKLSSRRSARRGDGGGLERHATRRACRFGAGFPFSSFPPSPWVDCTSARSRDRARGARKTVAASRRRGGATRLPDPGTSSRARGPVPPRRLCGGAPCSGPSPPPGSVASRSTKASWGRGCLDHRPPAGSSTVAEQLERVEQARARSSAAGGHRRSTVQQLASVGSAPRASSNRLERGRAGSALGVRGATAGRAGDDQQHRGQAGSSAAGLLKSSTGAG